MRYRTEAAAREVKDAHGCTFTVLGELTRPGLERPPAFRAFFYRPCRRSGIYAARSTSVSSHRPNSSPSAIPTSSLIFFRSVFFRSVVHTPLGTAHTKLLAYPAEKIFPKNRSCILLHYSGLDYPPYLGEMCA